MASGTYLDGGTTDLDGNGVRESTQTWAYGCTSEESGGSTAFTGGVYLTGKSTAAGDQNPVTAGAAQNAVRGVVDAYVTKFSPDLASLDYFTFLGGDDHDSAYDIAVTEGYAFVTGKTYSIDFPTTAGAAFEFHTLAGSPDQCREIGTDKVPCHEGFVTRVNRDGTGFMYVTFLGDQDADYGRGIAVDSGKNAYVTGISSPDESTSQAFVTKLSAMGGTEMYRRVFGGLRSQGYDIDVDDLGRAHISGSIGHDGHATGIPVSASYSGNTDGFLARLDAVGNLTYLTYLGGDELDKGYSLVLGDNDCSYLGLETWSDPVNLSLPNALQPNLSGEADVLLLRHCPTPCGTAITVEKSVTPQRPTLGATSVFEINISNSDCRVTGPIHVSDTVPPPYRVTGVTGPNCNFDPSTNLVECTLDDIPVGGTTIEIQATTPSCIGSRGLVTNSVDVTLPDGSVFTAATSSEPVICEIQDIDIGGWEIPDHRDEVCTSSDWCGGDLVCAKKCVKAFIEGGRIENALLTCEEDFTCQDFFDPVYEAGTNTKTYLDLID